MKKMVILFAEDIRIIGVLIENIVLMNVRIIPVYWVNFLIQMFPFKPIKLVIIIIQIKIFLFKMIYISKNTMMIINKTILIIIMIILMEMIMIMK